VYVLIVCDPATSRTWRRRQNLGCSTTEEYAVMDVKEKTARQHSRSVCTPTGVHICAVCRHGLFLRLFNQITDILQVPGSNFGW